MKSDRKFNRSWVSLNFLHVLRMSINTEDLKDNVNLFMKLKRHTLERLRALTKNQIRVAKQADGRRGTR